MTQCSAVLNMTKIGIKIKHEIYLIAVQYVHLQLQLITSLRLRQITECWTQEFVAFSALLLHLAFGAVETNSLHHCRPIKCHCGRKQEPGISTTGDL